MAFSVRTSYQPSRFLPALGLTLLVSAIYSSEALALSFDLSKEFDEVEADASYATVTVAQSGVNLDFSVMLNGLLGAGEDAHELYFNLIGIFTGLNISASNALNTAYTVLISPSVTGGAGSSFDFGVNLGNGAGPPGNGALTLATFTLSADQNLTPTDLLESSFTNGGIEAQMALHIQGTSTSPGSETVGGVVPEPSTAILLGLGLGVLGGRGSLRRRIDR